MKSKSTLREDLQRSIFLLPAILLMATFFILPIIMTVYYSFTDLSLSGQNAQNFSFVGFKNYKTLFSDRYVRTSIVNTVIFLIGCLVGQQVLGFFLAYTMRSVNTITRRIVGTIVLAGWVMPEIVVALSCSTFFSDTGTLNSLLGFIGIESVSWLFEFAMLSVILANVWHGTAFSMLNFQSALDGVPSDITEAARVDGAGKSRILFQITIPCIKNTIATNTMLNTLQTLGVFGLIYVMTGGGPGDKTLTLPILMYRQAFVSQQLGYGTAIAMILLVIGIFFSVIYTRLIKE